MLSPFHILSFVYLSGYVFAWTLPLQNVQSALSTLADENRIGVGFDFGPSYGTAAISYPNGTLVSIARVEGNDMYRKTMCNLSLRESEHPAPPYSDFGERWRDIPRQAERKERKALGLPASEDVGALSTVVSALRYEVEAYLGQVIESAAASVPHFPAIYDEDLYDAFEFVGLEYIQLMRYTYQKQELTWEAMAVLAGYGFGLCENYTDPNPCRNPHDPSDPFLLVYYTNPMLEVVFADMQDAYYVSDHAQNDFSLGHDALHNNPKTDYYWAEVRNALLRGLLSRTWEKPTKIILIGESSGDIKFRHVLDDVLQEYYHQDKPPIYSDDPLFVGARGVAEFVRRAPYRPKPMKPSFFI